MSARNPRLLRVAARLAGAIDPESCLLVGALATAVHGYARATADVDLVCRLSLVEVRKRLVEHGATAVLERGDPLEGEFDCLRGTFEGVEFDVLPPLVAIDWKHSIDLSLPGGHALRVVDLRTLIHLKLRAGGPQDVLDVAMLLQRHPDETARALELATAFKLGAQLKSFLEHPRVRAKRTRGRSTRRRPRT